MSPLSGDAKPRPKSAQLARGVSADADTIREALGAPAEHHDRCNTRAGKACDCYMRAYTPALDALAALERRVQELEQALEGCLQYGIDEDGMVWIATNPSEVGVVAKALGYTKASIRARLAGGEETPA